MKYILRFLYPYLTKHHVGGADGELMPPSIVTIIRKVYPVRMQLGIVAYILRGRDITTIAENSLGCAEVVSRMIRVLHPSFPICIGTATLHKEMRNSWLFSRTWAPSNGTIYLAETGTGKLKHGHVGVRQGGVVWSNNSLNGTVDSHMTVEFFDVYYFLKSAFPRNYYNLIK